MVYSAANLNRPLEMCKVCKLDHAPLKPDLLQIINDKKEAKCDIKKQDIKN